MKDSSSTAVLAVKPIDPYLTSGEACRLLRMSAKKLYELIADGQIKSFKSGTRRLVDSKSIVAYLARCETSRQERDPRISKMIQARQANRAARAAARAEVNAKRPRLGARR
ncbi:MAG: helix-turn-helix domain-containing protein [Burkholderiales bacterium]|nr:helix-turn-helix domain-containing protein [Burkholderiales bacterium]